MHIAYYCVGIAIVNGWLLYRRHMNQKGIPKKRRLRLIQFQAQIGNCLIRAGKIVERSGKRRRPSGERNETVPQKARRPAAVPLPTKEVQQDKFGHFPQFQEQQQRCHHCKDGFSTVKCSKCNIYLCLVKKRNCFVDFHN